MHSANDFATWALLLWLPISFITFAYARAPVAAAGLFLGGMLFLPQGVGWNWEWFPSIGKEKITALCVLLAAVTRYRARLMAARPLRGLEWLIVLAALLTFATAATNADLLHYGPRTVSRLTLWDGVSMGSSTFLRLAIPFFLGRVFIRSAKDMRDVLKLLALAGVVYSAFILVEVRMSPQWHKWIYGFHQHSFGQHVRFGGYRPMVFMTHGVAVALFVAASVIAAATLHRARIQPYYNIPAGWLTTYLMGILVICKSLAAIVYGAVLVPVMRFVKVPTLRWVVLGIAIAQLSYPYARLLEVFPTETVVSASSLISQARADSLNFRFKHEEEILDKVRQRFLWGWGGYGRGRVYDDRGRDQSVTDSQWILWMSGRGAPGMFLRYTVMLLPVLYAMWYFRRIRDPRDRILVLGMCMVIDLYAVDTLTNALMVNFPFFLSGALWGSLPAVMRAPARQPSAHEAPAEEGDTSDPALDRRPRRPRPDGYDPVPVGDAASASLSELTGRR